MSLPARLDEITAERKARIKEERRIARGEDYVEPVRKRQRPNIIYRERIRREGFEAGWRAHEQAAFKAIDHLISMAPSDPQYDKKDAYRYIRLQLLPPLKPPAAQPASEPAGKDG